MIVWLILFISISVEFTLCQERRSDTGCQIDPQRDNAPILIRYGTKFVYPKPGEWKIHLARRDRIELACPGNFVAVDGKKINSNSTLRVYCHNANKLEFSSDGALYDWEQITCVQKPISSTKVVGFCGREGTLVEIGFHLDTSRFARVMEICFNPTSNIALYSSYNLIPALANTSNTERPTHFQEDQSLYSIGSVKSLYSKNTQRRTINNLLGLSPEDITYFGTNRFLSRGHLAARADFPYAVMMQATFKYINCVPQWQEINKNNWYFIEREARKYVVVNNAKLEVWTGTHGVAALPHSHTRKATHLYLYIDGHNKALPVPALIWKLLYNRRSHEGVVLITLNNPYLDLKDVRRYKICEDVTKDLKNFLNFDTGNIQKGYMYACEVKEFLSRMPHALRINTLGLGLLK